VSDGRTLTALSMGLREYARMPVLLALLAVLPAYLILVFAALVPETPVALTLPGGGRVQVPMVDAYIAMFTPLVAGLVGAIAGLFLLRATREADSRLTIAGYRSRELLAARVGLLGLVGASVTAVAVGVTFLTPFEPAHLGWLVVATLLCALTYGVFGVLAGLVLDRLAGVYLVLFGSMIDIFVFQNPLATETAALAELLPGHVPVELAMRAGFGSVDPAALAPGLAYLAVLAAVALAAFYQSTRPA
jgi:putative Mn2+ efflux pump MntP